MRETTCFPTLLQSLNKYIKEGKLTLAEAITIASRVHKKYTDGGDLKPAGEPWYQSFVDYALDNGIIKLVY